MLSFRIFWSICETHQGVLSISSWLELQVLASSGFKFESSWAAVLPGSSEGIYGFVAANYANGALQKAVEAQQHGLPAPDQDSFVGVLELGGASLQVEVWSTVPASIPMAMHLDTALTAWLEEAMYSLLFLTGRTMAKRLCSTLRLHLWLSGNLSGRR